MEGGGEITSPPKSPFTIKKIIKKFTTRLQDFCIKMGSDESHFSLSLIVRDKVTIRHCPQTTTQFQEKGEPKRIRTEFLPLTSLTPYMPNRLTVYDLVWMRINRRGASADDGQCTDLALPPSPWFSALAPSR